MSRALRAAYTFAGREPVLCVTAGAAGLSMLLVPPDRAYRGYIDGRVLGLLLCLMLTVAGFQKLHALDALSQLLAARAPGARSLALVLVLLCFFSSMVMTNDVALLTFVPLAVAAFSTPGQERRLMLVVALQTAGANLGSMLTPLGNPQNLYLYSFYQPGAGAFFAVTAPLAAAGLALCAAGTLLVRGGAMSLQFPLKARVTDRKGLALCIALAAVSVAAVFRAVPWPLALGGVCAAALVWERRLFLRVDWGLLATFVCFFVFVGNLQRVDAVRALLTGLLDGRELAAGVLCSQVVSNVPAAVMLSGFTDDWRALVAGTNVGGLGTLVASLASLISFRLYSRARGARPGEYLLLFTALNLVMLVPLWALAAALV